MLGDQFEKQKEEIKELRSTFFSKTVTLLLGGFGLVAALAWNDAIQTLFKQLFAETSGGLVAKFLYALVVTGILALVSIKLSRDEQKH